MKNKIRLGVNVDHVATLRQVRGRTTSYPDLLQSVLLSVRGGAEQITIHLREDRRHIQLEDLKVLSEKCPVSLNLEMAPELQMFKYARKFLPAWICLVPEKREELTTEGGLDLSRNFDFLKKEIERTQQKGIEVSCFIEPHFDQVHLAHKLGADAVEFHTGHWVLASGEKKKKIWNSLVDSAKRAHDFGLGVHAGHGLDFGHAQKLCSLPHLREVNIGHSLICYSLEYGLEKATRLMKKCLKR
jgi:pyridoxine 5-phosphate synthase